MNASVFSPPRVLAPDIWIDGHAGAPSAAAAVLVARAGQLAAAVAPVAAAAGAAGALHAELGVTAIDPTNNTEADTAAAAARDACSGFVSLVHGMLGVRHRPPTTAAVAVNV